MSKTSYSDKRMSMHELTEHHRYLLSRSKIALKRAKAAGSPGAEVQIAELENRLQAVRRDYSSIDLRTHPNVVLAELAMRRGQEHEILLQLDIWKNAKSKKKEIDTELELCDNALRERQELEDNSK